METPNCDCKSRPAPPGILVLPVCHGFDVKIDTFKDIEGESKRKKETRNRCLVYAIYNAMQVVYAHMCTL
jgi:hypothetical protein